MAYYLQNPSLIDTESGTSCAPPFNEQAMSVLMRRQGDLQILWKIGLLSFEPEIPCTLDQGRAAELLFIDCLLRAGVGTLSIPDLVTGLESPLSYPIARLHYNLARRRWYQLGEATTAEDLREDIRELQNRGNIELLRVVYIAAVSAIGEIAEALAAGETPPRPKGLIPSHGEQEAEPAFCALDVDYIDRIRTGTDGTLTFQGHRVLVYIREQYLMQDGTPNNYKFHVAECMTIRNMRQRNRPGPYGVASKRDKDFFVNYLTQEGQVAQERVSAKLSVCKHCLTTLNWQRPAHWSSKDEERMWGPFSPEEFLVYYGSL